MIRVLVADDQPLFREGVLMLIAADPELEIVGEAGDGDAAITLARETRPDVVLMDLRMPGTDGIAATARIRAELPATRVLVLTTFGDDDSVFGALAAGAHGYLLKDASSAELRRAVRDAVAGAAPLQGRVAAKIVGELSRRLAQAPNPLVAPDGLLSEREREVLRMIARGASNKEIATKLFIAEGTVKNHVTHIFDKLDVTDCTAAALKARDLGLA